MQGTIDINAVVATAPDDFPSLARLCGAYFHQDWHEEHATTAAAADAFLADAPPGTVTETVADIDRLLALHLDDDVVGRILREGLDCNYVPMIDERTNTQWLGELRNLLLSRTQQ